MNFFKIQFRDRSKAVCFPVNEESFSRAKRFFFKEPEELGFLEFETLYGQKVWVNSQRIQVVQFLLEVHDDPKFDVSKLDPSAEFSEDEKERYGAGWEVSFWLAGRNEAFDIGMVSGEQWMTITSCVEDKFVFAVDGDGEEVAIRTADIDLLVGLEIDRYPEEDQYRIAMDEVECVSPVS